MRDLTDFCSFDLLKKNPSGRWTPVLKGCDPAGFLTYQVDNCFHLVRHCGRKETRLDCVPCRTGLRNPGLYWQLCVLHIKIMYICSWVTWFLFVFFHPQLLLFSLSHWDVVRKSPLSSLKKTSGRMWSPTTTRVEARRTPRPLTSLPFATQLQLKSSSSDGTYVQRRDNTVVCSAAAGAHRWTWMTWTCKSSSSRDWWMPTWTPVCRHTTPCRPTRMKARVRPQDPSARWTLPGHSPSRIITSWMNTGLIFRNWQNCTDVQIQMCPPFVIPTLCKPNLFEMLFFS